MANKHSWFLTINNPNEAELKLCHLATSKSVENSQHFYCGGDYNGKFSHMGYVPDVTPTKESPIKGLAYFGYSQEVGKHGTPHLHCVVIFKNAKSFQQVKNVFPRANIQPVRGTFQEATDYIRKAGRFFSTSFVTKEKAKQYVENDNQLAKLALEGDISVARLDDRITSLETKLDKLILLISQKKLLNTLSPDETVL